MRTLEWIFIDIVFFDSMVVNAIEKNNTTGINGVYLKNGIDILFIARWLCVVDTWIEEAILQTIIMVVPSNTIPTLLIREGGIRERMLVDDVYTTKCVRKTVNPKSRINIWIENSHTLLGFSSS